MHGSPQNASLCLFTSTEPFTDLRKFSKASSTLLLPYLLSPGLRFRKRPMPHTPPLLSFTHAAVRPGCYTQGPQMGGFRTTGLDFTQFWRLGVRPGSRHGRVLVTTLFGWQTADFSPCPHMAERAGDPSGAPFMRHHPHDLTTPQSHSLTVTSVHYYFLVCLPSNSCPHVHLPPQQPQSQLIPASTVTSKSHLNV